MKLNEYASYDATGLADLVRRGEVTPVELTRLAREAYDVVNPVINAVVEFYDDAESVPGSDTGPFAGVPALRKDIGPTEAGRLQEAGSRLLRGFRPTVDSYFIGRARAGGLRLVGRTAVPELAHSGLTESTFSGITRNPWDLERTPGGSSGGSAAAVSAGIVPIATSGDGGGSTRGPASNCGLVGMNPSRGRISGGPLSQDPSYGNTRHFVLCRTVRDMAASLDVLRGAAPGDPFVIASPERPYLEELDQPTGRLRVGVAISPWGLAKLEPDVLEAVEKTAKHLEEMGHHVEEVLTPYDPADHRKIIAGYYHMGSLSLDAKARALGRNVDEQTLEYLNLEFYRISKTLPLSYAADFFEVLRKMRADVGEATKEYDILLTPTMPCTALRHGTYTTANKELTPDEYVDADSAIFAYGFFPSVTGQPSVSLPLFRSENDMPIGIQIVSRFGDEATLVHVARDLQESIPWAAHRPPVFAGDI